MLLVASVVRLFTTYQSAAGAERRDTMPRYEVVLFDADHTLFDLTGPSVRPSARRWRRSVYVS